MSSVIRLVTTVGQDLEVETSGRLAKGPQQGINDLSVYFKEMGKLVEKKAISSRVRFLMQVLVNFVEMSFIYSLFLRMLLS